MSDYITTKKCNKCQIEKELSDFSKCKSNNDGLQSSCKQCVSKYNKANSEKERPVIHGKICGSCLSYKNASNFSQCSYTKDGLHAWCTECRHKYYLENKEKNSEYVSEYTKLHRAETSQRMKGYRRNNADKIAKSRHERRAMILEAEGSHSVQEIRDLFSFQLGLCFWCDVKLKELFDNPEGDNGAKPHLDHVIPLKRGGSNYISNLVWSCASCNLSKGAKLPSEWDERGKRWKE